MTRRQSKTEAALTNIEAGQSFRARFAVAPGSRRKFTRLIKVDGVRGDSVYFTIGVDIAQAASVEDFIALIRGDGYILFFTPSLGANVQC